MVKWIKFEEPEVFQCPECGKEVSKEGVCIVCKTKAKMAAVKAAKAEVAAAVESHKADLAMAAAVPGGDKAAFEELVQMVMEEAGHKCHYCGKPASGVHHEDEHSHGWVKHMSLVAICPDCHDAAHGH